MTQEEPKALSNSQRAIVQLRRLIFSGEISAGSDHLESELADRLGMSRTPVREAALILECQGLVALRPREGVRILPISGQDMAEIYDILTELESMAAHAAAARHPPASELAALEDALDRMDGALALKSLDDWAKADEAFHVALIVLGGNSRARMIFEMMSDQVRRARSVTLTLRPLPIQSNTDHRRVFEAIQAGDADSAARIHRAHRVAAKEMMLSLLGRHNLNFI